MPRRGAAAGNVPRAASTGTAGYLLAPRTLEAKRNVITEPAEGLYMVAR